MIYNIYCYIEGQKMIVSQVQGKPEAKQEKKVLEKEYNTKFYIEAQR